MRGVRAPAAQREPARDAPVTSAQGATTTSGGAVPRLVHEPRMCDAALTRAFGFLGKRWNGVILATLFQGPAGFAELKRAITGISDSMLSERLAELGRARLVVRTVDEGPPLSVAYALTPAGEALLPALQELTAWAALNLPADSAPTHGPCEPSAT